MKAASVRIGWCLDRTMPIMLMVCLDKARGAGIMPRMQPSPVEAGDVTQLLQRWSNDERAALDELIHDAYLKLVDVRRARFRDRADFLAMASRVMRRLLVDHAGARRAAKRGGGLATVKRDLRVAHAWLAAELGSEVHL
jgi:hypothetical protein